MIIGKIAYYSEQKDEAYITVLSVDKFLERYDFKPSLVKFKVGLEQLICISLGNNIIEFLEFNVEAHKVYLNLNDIKTKSGGISIPNNLKYIDFIIDNEIDNRQNPKLNELKQIKKLINYRIGYPSHYVNYSNPEHISEEIEQYKIIYNEGGYNKPGDWSNGWICVESTTSYKKLDVYLERLLPNFKFKLGQSNDCEEYKFKNDIIGKLRNEIGEENINDIQSLCSIITKNIKSFARLMYREEEHALALWHYCDKLKKEIKDEYILKCLKL